jgi:hypothetical protein
VVADGQLTHTGLDEMLQRHRSTSLRLQHLAG